MSPAAPVPPALCYGGFCGLSVYAVSSVLQPQCCYCRHHGPSSLALVWVPGRPGARASPAVPAWAMGLLGAALSLEQDFILRTALASQGGYGGGDPWSSPPRICNHSWLLISTQKDRINRELLDSLRSARGKGCACRNFSTECGGTVGLWDSHPLIPDMLSNSS